MVEPYTLKTIDSAGKAIVENSFKLLLDRIDSIDTLLRGDFNIQGREMRIDCPDSLQHYSVSFESKKSFLPRKIRFNFGKVKRVAIKPVMSLNTIHEGINYLEDGFEIDLRKLESNELYLMDIDYKIEDKNFVDSLVQKKVSKDSSSSGDVEEHWIEAHLKHVPSLKGKFACIELRDMDFGVDVSVHQDIKMKVPEAFQRQLATIMRLTKKIGRSESHNVFTELLHQQRNKYSGSEVEILQQLQNLFVPVTFKKYLDVKQDFSYFDCERGTEYFNNLPFPTWPKTMKVISRTDLNLEEPAADGTLIYKREDFKKDIAKIFK